MMPELLPFEPLSPEWHAARRQGVTATDIVTILGLSHYDSVYSLFWRKLGQVGEVEDNDRFRLGRELQPYVTSRWVQEGTNWKDFVRWGSGLYRHGERAWQMATPDQVLGPPDWLTGDPVVPVAVLEVKTWADADRRAWGQGEVFDEHGLLIHDAQIPPAVRAQVLWQMDVMGVAAGHVGVVFLPSGEFRSYTLEHDESPVKEYPHDVPGRAWSGCELCVDQILMREAGEEFMARLRLELPPPDPDSSLATLTAVRARFARVPAKQAEIDPNLWAVYVENCEAVKDWERDRRTTEILIREQAGEAAELCVDGQVVARRIISHATVKEHVRHQDYLRRVKQQGDDDE